MPLDIIFVIGHELCREWYIIHKMAGLAGPRECGPYFRFTTANSPTNSLSHRRRAGT
jgi:hypothetical protein